MTVKHVNRRYLNIWEVEDLLPKVEYTFNEMTRLRSRMLNVMKNVKACGGELIVGETPVFSSDPAVAAMEKRLFELSKQYGEHLEEIIEMGAMTDNIEIGAFDFYSFYDGMEIVFCWQYGEEEVAFWHYPNEDFNDRRHVDFLFSYPDSDCNVLH